MSNSNGALTVQIDVPPSAPAMRRDPLAQTGAALVAQLVVVAVVLICIGIALVRAGRAARARRRPRVKAAATSDL